MFRVFYCLTGEHDWRLVVLAVFVCLLASLVAVSLFHRARVAHARSRQAWLLLAGAATGCGIWATHFIAMLAYEPSVPVSYDAGLTAASFAVATLVTIAGLKCRGRRVDALGRAARRRNRRCRCRRHAFSWDVGFGGARQCELERQPGRGVDRAGRRTRRFGAAYRSQAQ